MWAPTSLRSPHIASWRAAPRGPRPTPGPHPCRRSRAAAPPFAKVVCAPRAGPRPSACPARLLRTPRPAAPGPLPLRSSAPARRARRLSAALAAPAAAPPLGLVRAAALRRLSLAPSAFGPGLAALRAPCSVALAALGLGPAAARGPAASSRRAPPGFGACPPRCARRRRLRAPAAGPPVGGPLAAPRPGPLAARPRLRGLAGRLSGAAVVAVGLSPAPPRPAAPAGGSGERVASGLGSRFSRPSRGCAAGSVGAPVRRSVRG